MYHDCKQIDAILVTEMNLYDSNISDIVHGSEITSLWHISLHLLLIVFGYTHRYTHSHPQHRHIQGDTKTQKHRETLAIMHS